MNRLKIMLIISLSGLFALSCNNTGQKETGPFKYLADEFADIKVIRFKVPGWDSLSLQQKEYIYHLSEAAKSGRDILWDQNFKYNLKVRKILESIFDNYQGEKESEDYKEFIVYAKRVFFSNGIHHHYAEEKIIPGCTKEYFMGLMLQSGTDSSLCNEILPVIYSPDIYPLRKNISGKGDLLMGSSVNFYDSVSKEEAEKFYALKEDPDDPHPVSYGLNSKLVKRDGVVTEEVYRSGGLYGTAIDSIVSHLEKAAGAAENDIQKKYIKLLVDYYKSGDLKTWDEYNIVWASDTSSRVDFINGFIENYNDPLGMKATWEAMVNIKDIEASERTRIISENAQWFEDNSPVDPKYKKEEVTKIDLRPHPYEFHLYFDI